MKSIVAVIKKELQTYASPERARISKSFFKTGKGQYGEGDVFIGVPVPDTRIVAKKYVYVDFENILEILASREHEYRLLALHILVLQYKKADIATRKKIAQLYLAHTAYINNWDLVDTSAAAIIGSYVLETKNEKILYKLIQSKNLWERRIAMIATHAYIKTGDPSHTFAFAQILFADPHDLSHKATGWMLREVGKYSGLSVLKEFLITHYVHIPRTALRYAIEHFPEKERKELLGYKS
ncbi:MAG: DNA alkylation repair protein [bacterium]